MESLLDAFDRRILEVMHEFEYDPFRERHSGPPHRISPVPLYLLHAATCPLTEQRVDGKRWPTTGPDVHARVEALKTLGFAREGDRNWPEFSIRTMRDGRFISVDSELGDGPRPSKSRPEHTIVRCLYREYHVRFGHHSDLDAALETAGYNKSGAAHIEIMESVMRTFRYLSWHYYDEASKKKWSKQIGIPYREDLSWYGLCYALNPNGIAAARVASKQTADPASVSMRDEDRPSSPMPDDRYEWASQIESVRATNQVLGEGTLHKGILSRACANGHVETNGKAGRAARVRVSSFLTWVSRRCDLEKCEQDQVRNAVIGEITARNS